MLEGFPGGSEVKASAWNAGDLGLTPGSGLVCLVGGSTDFLIFERTQELFHRLQ